MKLIKAIQDEKDGFSVDVTITPVPEDDMAWLEELAREVRARNDEEVVRMWVAQNEGNSIRFDHLQDGLYLLQPLSVDGKSFFEACLVQCPVMTSQDVYERTVRILPKAMEARTVHFQKMDADTLEPVSSPGLFALFSPNSDELLQQAVSDSDGLFSFPVTSPCFLKEIVAPEGYRAEEESYELRLLDDGILFDGIVYGFDDVIPIYNEFVGIIQSESSEPDSSSSVDSIQTGQESRPLLWLLLMGGSAMVFTVARRGMKREED